MHVLELVSLKFGSLRPCQERVLGVIYGGVETKDTSGGGGGNIIIQLSSW